MVDPVILRLTLGLQKLRDSWGYKETRKRARAAGVAFSSTAMGQAEGSLMVSPPTYAAVKRGRDLLHGSWGWNQTKRLNVIPAVFARTLIAQADVLFAEAQSALVPSSWGVFGGNGVQCLHPNGGVENGDEFRAGGFTLASYNVGDHDPADWDHWHTRMAQFGILTGPWRRSLVPADSIAMCQLAEQKGEKYVIHNVETELQSSFPPSELAKIVRRFPGLKHALQPEPWIQNNVRLDELADLGVIVLVEAYLNADPRFLPRDLAMHARDLGAGLVGATFGAGQWSDAPFDIPPAVYFQAWPNAPYWVYPIDSKDARVWRRP